MLDRGTKRMLDRGMKKLMEGIKLIYSGNEDGLHYPILFLHPHKRT